MPSVRMARGNRRHAESPGFRRGLPVGLYGSFTPALVKARSLRRAFRRVALCLRVAAEWHSAECGPDSGATVCRLTVCTYRGRWRSRLEPQSGTLPPCGRRVALCGMRPRLGGDRVQTDSLHLHKPRSKKPRAEAGGLRIEKYHDAAKRRFMNTAESHSSASVSCVVASDGGSGTGLISSAVRASARQSR